MTDLRKASEELIKEWDWECGEYQNKALTDLIEALRQALSQPEQEPVAWGMRRKDGVILDIKNADFEHEGYEKIYTVPLYTTPSKRKWVGLTNKEKQEIASKEVYWAGLVYAVEAKLKEKNNG